MTTEKFLYFSRKEIDWNAIEEFLGVQALKPEEPWRVRGVTSYPFFRDTEVIKAFVTFDDAEEKDRKCFWGFLSEVPTPTLQIAIDEKARWNNFEQVKDAISETRAQLADYKRRGLIIAHAWLDNPYIKGLAKGMRKSGVEGFRINQRDNTVITVLVEPEKEFGMFANVEWLNGIAPTVEPSHIPGVDKCKFEVK